MHNDIVSKLQIQKFRHNLRQPLSRAWPSSGSRWYTSRLHIQRVASKSYPFIEKEGTDLKIREHSNDKRKG